MAKRKSTGATPKEPVVVDATTEAQPKPYQWKSSRKRKEQAKVGPAVVVEILQSALVQVGAEFGEQPVVVIDPPTRMTWIMLPAAISFCPQCRRVKQKSEIKESLCSSCRELKPSLLQPKETTKEPAATGA